MGSVLVMGAGSVGCFVGGVLAAAGVDVTFVGRPRILDALRSDGLRLTDLDGADVRLPPDALRLHERVPNGLAPTLVLLAVKSSATAEAAAELQATLPAGTLMLSLQNGVANAQAASTAAPALKVLPGMVPYNIAQIGSAAFHRGTGGALAAQDDAALRPWLPVFERAGVLLQLHPDMRAVQWGKLLINLNNPVNALSGLPLKAQLLERDYRRCFAALIEEAVGVLDAAGIAPAQLVTLPPRRLPVVLRLPTWLFRRVAARMLRIDEHARSSMADDLALGRRTEVDALCGEVLRLAQARGMDAPRNRRMVELLDTWPAAPGRLSGPDLRRAINA
jgi:2-dehydropantoate 2-reductase